MALHCNEFMVGNFAYDEDGNPCKIIGVSRDNVIFENGDIIKDVKPIKLTSQILEESGWFTENLQGGKKIVYKHPKNTVGVRMTDNGFIVGILTANSFNTYYHLAYLHQMQQFMTLAGWNNLAEDFSFPNSMYKPTLKKKKVEEEPSLTPPAKAKVETFNKMSEDITGDIANQLNCSQPSKEIKFESMEDLFPTVDIPEIKF